MEHFETKLTSDTKFVGKVITVTLDRVELENGKTSMREIVHHHGGATVIALTKNKEIYLVKQFRYAFGKQLWEIPAGKLEKNEDPFEAAKRELEEEVGITAENYYDLGEFYPTVGFCTEIIYSYCATNLTETNQNLDEDEFITVEKVPFDKAFEMVMNGDIKDGKTIASILKIKHLLDAGTIII